MELYFAGPLFTTPERAWRPTSAHPARSGRYNPLVAESATIRPDLPVASTTDVIAAILEALSAIKLDQPGNS